MHILRGLEQLNRKYPNPVVAIGVFDGMHRAHTFLLREVARKARGIRGTAIAITFFPHPHVEQDIYSLEHRLALIESTGVDVCLVIRFNRRFAALSAQDFVERVLVNKIGTRYVFVGKDFRFGRRGRGNVLLLSRLSKEYHFTVRPFEIVKIAGHRVSSTRIRQLIKSGDLAAARMLLGRPVSVLGTVIKGDSLGRKLGYPTANLDPHHEVLPPSGIYAVRGILKQRLLKGACYIGTRPTIARPPQRRLSQKGGVRVEVFLFNFHKNIYGKYLEIQFLKKIREDKRFSSKEALTQQIKKDISKAGKILRRSP